MAQRNRNVLPPLSHNQMSSEDKTLEPSDQGSSPAPASSTTATPAGSPAIADKRPRGRPRKDGVAPVHKSKKKSRSRGKVSVDDEDSMDGVETAETESAVETETKEQPVENEGIPAAEEKLSSPGLHRSVSEESAGALASAASQTKSSEQLCAFCNCGERSLLGQGELKQFSPSPGYTMPRRSQCRTKRDSTGSNDGEGNSSPKLNSTARRQRGQKKDASPCSAAVSVVAVNTPCPGDEPASKFWDELSQVGLPEDTDLQSLSDPSGCCWAHQCCAAWSEGVCREQEQVLVNVDKAVDSGSTTHCAYCKRLGATIKCCEEKCSRLYHYPCAAAAAAFQDIRSHTLLCPEHIEQATGRSKDEANCALCDSPGDLLDQLFCTSCGQHYHGMCLDIGVTPLKRAGWQCPDCKVCQTCKNPGEDSKMLVCDTCDKGYHTFCLQPVMDSIPTNSWRCKNCRVCEQCGTRTSFQWHHNCLLCDNCYQQKDMGLSCPLCGKAIHPDSQKDMLCCQMCKRWIHLDCDRQAENETSVLLKDGYVCTVCKQVELEELQASQTCGVLETAEPAEELEPACLERVQEAVEEAGNLEHAAEENQLKEEQKPVESAAEPAQVTTMVPKVSVPPSPPFLAKQETPEEVETAAAAAAPTESQLERELQPQNSEVPAEVVPPAPEEAGTESGAAGVEPMEVSAAEPTQTQERLETAVQERRPLETPALAQEHLALELSENHEVAQVSDSSLLVEMDTIPASELSFSDLYSPSEDLTAPSQQCPESSFSVSVDTSKLAEPPVSVGIPPKDLPQVQAAPASSGGVPSTTFIPVAPKIGMGKPAITKRTFSPGRPRVRQGAWSTRNMSSSPSWSPDRSEGWDPSITSQLSSTPIWTVKVDGQLHDEVAHHMQNRRSSYMTRYLVTCSEKQGRGSGFPGRRRPRGAGVSGRGGRGRSKLKNAVGTVITPGAMIADTSSVKDEEENSMHNTVVLFSSSDRFTMKQDMCVVCGSFGRGPEGRLLACAQCGQCYHPYCVSVKITKVVLSKGWRCLECTVCEACGKATDPGRLLLCDDCDISYHTYCLDPPLQTVPKGGWKCKWCVSCTHCGATSPGLRCEWQNNYTQCAPCGSLATCPVCSQNYKEDELIVQCRQCDRWIHASCQNLNSEEELENAADNSFDCAMCRTHMTPSHGSVPEDPESPVLAHIVTKIKEQDPPKTYTQDGVCLTELGLSRLQNLTVAAPRRKRPKPKLKLKIINQNSVAVLQTPPDPQSELSRDGDLDDSREGDLLDCDGKSDSSPEREAADDVSKGAEGADGIKKRKRKPYRPGIGGFMVRQRSRTGQGKAKRSLCRKDSSGSVSEYLLGKEESWNEPLPDTPVEEIAPGSECLEKAKKRYRKKKNKLEEVFPAYLQEAFFGRNLLDTSRQSRLSLDALSDEDPARVDGRTPSVNTNFLDPSCDPLLSSTSSPITAKPAALSNPEDPLAALSEVLNTDDDILGILSDELVKPGEDSAGLDIGPVSDDSSLAPLASTGRSARPLPEEPLGGVLSPELDTMVTDGAILSKLYKIPELEGKDVEELFTAVLSPSANQTPQHTHIPLQNQGDGLFPRMPLMNGLMGPTPHFPSPRVPPGPGPCTPSTFSPIHRAPFTDSCRDKKPQFNELVNEAAGSWAAPAPVLEPEADTMSNAQRSTLKWEKEETLGEMATVAPVLYTNMNFPSLKEDFPEWSTRVKQIAKLWRKASSQERAPYVQKARDNRAALRINKVQMSNDTIKRQQHHQEIIDPNIPIESDLLFKDPLKPKESEHEQEWKFRQQLRQKNKQQAKIEATQKLEQVKSEQQQQLQQQQSSGQSGSDSPNSGNQSPLTPQPSNGNTSPAQETMPKDGFAIPQPPGTPTASSSNDVFLRPQAPPPTPTRMPVQDPFSQAQPAQPQSPQMFSPGASNSRPSSPWDPYAKMVGTPRPPAVGSHPPRRKSIDPCTPPPAGTRLGAEQQERNRPSPGHESFGSPSSINNDPYAKPPDTPRPVLSADLFAKPMGPPRTVGSAEQSGKLPLGSTASGDTFARPGLPAEVYQRMQMSHSRMILSDPYTRPLLTPIPGSNESGSVSLFKAPMPPSQSLQDPYPAMSSALRRMSVDPYQRPVLTPRPADGFSQNQMNDPFAKPPLTPRLAMNDNFSHPPRMSRQSQRDPFSQPGPIARPPSQDLYAQAPLTPGPAPLQSADPYSQSHSTPRPGMGERFAQSPVHQSYSDPYAQPPGTPRPVMNNPYSQSPGAPRLVMNDPYSQPTGTSRPVTNDPYSQPPGTPRSVMNDPYSQPPGTPRPITNDPYSQPQGTPRPVTNDSYSQPPGTPRSVMNDPYSQPPGTPRPVTNDPYSQPPGTPRPVTNDSYSQPPGTPRPVTNDPYSQPPGTPRPVTNDPYSQPPGTPRPVTNDPYSQPPGTPRPAMNDPYSQPPGTPRPVMNEPFSQPLGAPRPVTNEPFSRPPGALRPVTNDPYSQPPGTPRPVMNDPYSQPPGTPRPVMNDPYSQSPGTLRPVMNDPYSQSPGTLRPVMNDSFSCPPGTPRPGTSETINRPVVTRPGLMPNQGPFSPAPQNRAAGTQETFVCPSDPCSQTSKLSGMTEEPFTQPDQLNQTSIHDLCEQPPMTPQSQSGGVFDDGRLVRDITEQHGTGKEGNFGVSSTLNMAGSVAAGVTSEAQNNMHVSQGDTEEKLRQRLRLREIILRQQQQKIAVRQEKGLQDPALSAAPGTPRHWSQEDPNRPNELFNRPPPPYPGTIRGPLIPPGAQRFPGPFPSDPRGSFPRDRLFNRPPFTGDVTGMGMRPRFGYPHSGQGPIPSQERFLSPSNQMQGSMPGFPQQLRRSLSVDLPRPMGNPIGLHQHFPPRGMQMQQHNIMGQPFIELRHRAPESRLRLQFGPSLMAQENVMDPSSQRTGGFMTGQEMGFPGNQGSRLMEPTMNQRPGMVSHAQMSTSFEHIPQNQMQAHTGHPHAPLMRSLSHPVTSETFGVAPLDYFPSTSAESTEELPLASQDVIAEKLDPDDSAVKDLDDVEVKDLDDEDLENLNLDPEDGKGDDLDLETNDLHLDDFLRSGKFDIIAYTDPELDLGDKKDMFNEELDLSDPIEDHPEAVEEQKTKSKDVNTNSADVSPKKEATSGMKLKLEKTPERLQDVKQESSTSNENTDPPSSEHTIKTEAHAHAHPPTDKDQSEERNTRSQENTGGSPSLSEASAPSSTGTLAGSTPVLPSMLTKDKVDNTELGPLGSPTQSMSPAHQKHMTGMPQNPNGLMTLGQMEERAANPNVSMDEIMDHTFSQGAPPPVNPNFIQGHNFSAEQQIDPHIPMVNQSEPNGMSATEQALISQALSQQNRERPLLLDEQPLLLQDLLDQERQEQQQQRQMQAMIRQRSSDSFFPNIDFDAITDPIMKAKMVALKGINKVMVQNSMGMPSMVMNRFQFVGQQMPEPEVGEGVSVPQQAIGPDGKLAPQMARPNPPSFDPGFVNDAQKKQYEEWLQDTQQLLQMQQKFLEEQIGVHRKSKKALSAKQRTAKKAGREFPEDDAEQLKHVTEQQSVVQKQLEQIRKQQKEHAELIEEYRIKQQQQGTGAPALIQGVQSQAPMVPGGPPPVMTQQNFPILAQQMEQHLGPVPGHPIPPLMPGVPGWHPGAPVPMAGLRMQSQLPSHVPVNPAQALLPRENTPQAVAAAETSTAGNGAHVKFDDNNPFSEGFQERERKERLREQQERQRIQLMQEVERQRALQQRLELEQQQQQQQQQQGIVGPEMSRASLSQMPYFNSELPHDFMQRLQQQQLPTQQQMGQMFPQQQSMQQGFISPSPSTPFSQGNERRHIMGNGPFGPPDMPVGGPDFRPLNQGIQGANFVPGQPRPPAFMPAMSHGTGEGPPFGMEPVTPLPPSYPGSGQSLIQLYSNIIPEEKGKKKRNRKKRKEDDADSVKAPSTPHSDLTAPLTPSVSDTASTPTRIAASDSLAYNKGEPETAEFLAGSSTPRSGVSQLPTELERQLPASSSNGNTTHQQAVGRQSSIGSETNQLVEPAKLLHEIKLEQMEATECRGPRESKVEASEIVKLEGKEGTGHSPAHSVSGTGGKLESGNELLKHLLKNKNTPSLLPQQRSEEEEEEEGAAQSTLLQKQNNTEGAVPTADNKMQGNLKQQAPGLQRTDQEQDKKKQRNKRAPKSGEKPAPRSKKRKKDEDDRHVLYPNTDSLMSQLKQQLSLLPLMEPLIGVNFAHFPPYGSGRLSGENRLTGTFGSASLDGVSDYYSQLIYKQNNLSNPPTPPASLPPTPPPLARHKIVNGFATAEELASKAAVMRGPEVTKGLGPRQFQMPFRPEEDLLARAMAHGPKTVDVPASLPTPPHNNHEELRGQDHCDERDSPDSFVPSSSPESVLGMEVRRYPDLSLVKQEPPDLAPSPVIPILPSCSGKGSEFRLCDVKMEPSGVFFGPEFGQPANCSQSGLVSIAITLNPAAAGNITGVVAAVADLLHVKLPNSYEASAAPDRPPATLLNSMTVQHHHRFEHRPPPHFTGAGSGQPGVMRFMRPSGPSGMFQPQVRFTPINSGSVVVKRDEQFAKGNPGPKPQWCCHCKVVVLGNGVCKSAKDLPFNKQDLHEGPGRSEGNMVFCSHNCFVLYSTGMQAKATETQEATSAQLDSTPSKTFHQYSNNTSTLDVHCLPQLQPKESPAPTPPITFPPAASEMMKLESKPDELKVTVKLKPRPRAVQVSVDESRPLSKRWKGMRWRKWSVQITIPKGNLKLPCEGEITELLKRLGTSLRPEPLPKDHRKCCFCHEEGDGITDGPARLLNLDLDLWVHLNCALWSSEVYETQAGALINVELALRRGLSMKCLYCQKMGATSGCQRLRCTNIYHFTCALRAQCMFFKDKTMLCHMHRPRGGAPEHELRYFAVFRRVYVQRDEVKQIASIVQRGERDHTFRVGSLIFHSIGQLLPQQMNAFHNATAIFPVGYEASRLYWSMRYSNRRCRYMCSIDERDSQPEFIIRVVEQGHEDLVLTDWTPKGVWDKVLEPVAERRNESGTLKLFQAYLKGEDLFGLTVSAVVRIAESLPGVEACGSYVFRYGRNPLMQLPLSINPTGSARSQPKASNHVKRFVLRPHTLNSTSTSKSFQSTVTGELSAPYSKQFVHSKSSQYRKMKTEWKGNVYLARSRIQGLGLYAARDIEKHTMVIEYMGTVIRNEVARRKEKHYESQNRGVFMFRMDSEHVIDATLTGGPARYINHSCAPNCVAEVVTFEKGHKIIISSNQRIQRGQELCYDYKFDFEDDQHKIPCHCGAVNCRKWMN
ncbi:histone-lysine N-methyltransferase 2C-like isoform X5 [Polyodon spathula]|uniref:histone-lysine N-methyltransferase 2C-like isoform X5 n=1 Tax=Polyodon spathula TaxID=7913 RepID=UPI001B7DB0E7|nr:histone-lysine N-methyltransferase 2C-like isoform X5 [Polyodon spathula]